MCSIVYLSEYLVVTFPIGPWLSMLSSVFGKKSDFRRVISHVFTTDGAIGVKGPHLNCHLLPPMLTDLLKSLKYSGKLDSVADEQNSPVCRY